MVPLEETGAFQGSALLDQTETPEQQKLELDNFKSLFDSAVQALTEAQDEAEEEEAEAQAQEAEAAAAEAEVEAETAACEEARQTCDVTTCANSRAVVNECIATESGFKTECRCENGATASSWRESSSSVGGLLNSFFPTFDSIFRDDSFFQRDCLADPAIVVQRAVLERSLTGDPHLVACSRPRRGAGHGRRRRRQHHAQFRQSALDYPCHDFSPVVR